MSKYIGTLKDKNQDTIYPRTTKDAIIDMSIDTELAKKVNVNQGTSHAGEFLIVNSSGNVTPQAFATLTGGSY